MKAHLLFKDKDFDIQRELPPNADDLIKDLELTTLFSAMAQDDKFLSKVANGVILQSVESDLDTIHYRQAVLQDCLNNSSVVNEIYALSGEALEFEKKMYFGLFSQHPETILHRSMTLIEDLVGSLKKLKKIADQQKILFKSDGFHAFFDMLQKELTDEYFASVQARLKELKFRNGILVSAQLGDGNKGINYILRKPNGENKNWMKQFVKSLLPVYTIFISDRDESGARALWELRDRGINMIANVLAQSTDHILSFFTLLRTELAFYIGCMNLHDRLLQMDEPVCFPVPIEKEACVLNFRELYDVCLALSQGKKVVGNDLNADQKILGVITGANQGGKSIFLRSLGLGQLMMQSGMFVPAEAFSANLCNKLFTHYKREEDASMKSGKLDEELNRMNELVNQIGPNSMVLFNESFAATNEREGSEIARQIVNALTERGIKVFFVTHLYEFARHEFEKNLPNAIFLRAERKQNSERTFKIIEGGPLRTSFGEDVYHSIFNHEI